MKKLFNKPEYLENSTKKGINSILPRYVTISKLPIAILLITTFFLILPITRELTIWMLAENRPIELLTFVFFMVGGIRGVILAWQLNQRREQKMVVLFYLLFSLALLAIGAEEVSWGQWFVGFETPSTIKEINTQSELTLHNLEFFNDHLEIFPLLFGIAGIVSVWLNKIPSFRQISSPYVLLSWFVIIAGISAIDLLQDFYIIQKDFDALLNHLDELIEMLVGISGFFYVWINAKSLMKN